MYAAFARALQTDRRYDRRPVPRCLVSVAVAAALATGCCAVAAAQERVPVVPDSVGFMKWSIFPGTASQVAVAPDGSLWALSTAPAGSNKYLLHYTNGRWAGVSGPGADSIAAGPDGTLFASNSPKGIYAYDGKSWTLLGGVGLGDVTTGADGSIYALGLVTSNGNRAIWKKAGKGAWTRQPGAAEQLAGSFDRNAYAVPGVGTVRPNGYFALTSTGAIYYYSPGVGYIHFPGAASGIAPVLGGFFELKYPGSKSGGQLCYFDYASAKPTAEPEYGLRLATGRGGGGPWTQLYLGDFANRIWTTSVLISTPPVKVTEFALSAQTDWPTDIAAGADGAMWFTESDDGKIGRITLGGSIAEYTVPSSGSSPYGIAAGPDGALWFTDQGTNSIGRISLGGTVREYGLPNAGSAPDYITAGPDGALWFTEGNARRIGRITPAGAIKEYPVPSDDARGIAAGPDRALWFTEYWAGKIGRITTGGTVTEYAIPTSSTEPSGIAAGPDGALWFAEYNSTANKIGRVTTAGSFREFALPTAQSGPYAIGAGADGALWFTELGANQIGRITTAGTVSEYAIPTAGGPAGLAAGPDGALWFTEVFAGKIGHAALR